ncbi:MAG: DUF1571 domain-containing protein [Planctomycetes bacterium]|nr:DUF1571 domain-containing protein [Planctomycetota bacterium]
MRQVQETCSQLDQYTLLFTRTERRGIGLLASLHSPERIFCWFRKSPFSVRMKWLDEDVKYGESAYVQGREKDKVRFTPRQKPFNLPYRVYRVGAMTPVNWGECRYPMTDFGLERLMQQTIATIAAENGRCKFTYRGVLKAPVVGCPAHCILIEYPADRHPAPIQEIYFDSAVNLPVYTEMRFADGKIDTAYAYDQLDASVRLSDDDFLLPPEREESSAAAGSVP